MKPTKIRRKKSNRNRSFERYQLSMARQQELEKKLCEDEDYIFSKRHSNSLKKLLEEHEGGVSDKVIMRVLHLSKHELSQSLAGIIAGLGKKMGKNEVEDE